MEHMVVAVVLPAALNGRHVPGVRHHADGGAVPLGRGADGAQAAGGEVLAHRAAGDAVLGVQDGVGKLPGLLLGKAQHVKGQALGGLAADARQPGKLLHQLFQRCGEVLHASLLLIIAASGRQLNFNDFRRGVYVEKIPRPVRPWGAHTSDRCHWWWGG